MNITRRNFMRLSGMAALSVSVLGSAGKVFGQAVSGDDLYAIPVESLNDPLNYLTKDHFEPFVGATMRASSEGKNPIDFRLTEVKGLELAANVKRGFRGESFSLLFERSSSRRVRAGIYEFDGGLGRFQLAIMPVEKGGTRYEAIINRISR